MSYAKKVQVGLANDGVIAGVGVVGMRLKPCVVIRRGVDVDVGEELLCSPRRVGKIYAPLAAWYNAPERAALRAKHGPLPLSPDAFRKWPAMNLVTMAFLDDQGVPPAF